MSRAVPSLSEMNQAERLEEEESDSGKEGASDQGIRNWLKIEEIECMLKPKGENLR